MTDGEAADDGELARRAAAGDERAFTALMRRHKQPLYRLVRRLTGGDDAALDVLQESFVALWRNIGRYDAQLPFGAWARRVAINKTRDWARRRRVRRFVAMVMPGEPMSDRQADDRPSPEREAGGRRELARLEAAIAALPDRLREALVLTAIEGLSQGEAATVLGVSAKAVETRVARARRHLLATGAG